MTEPEDPEKLEFEPLPPEEVQKRLAKKRKELSEEIIIGNLDERVARIVTSVENMQFPSDVLLIRDALILETLDKYDLYMSLQEHFRAEDDESFARYLEKLSYDLQALIDNPAAVAGEYEPRHFNDLILFKEVIDQILDEFCYLKPSLFTPKVDQYIASIRPDLEETASDIFRRADLNPNNFKQTPEIAIEMHMRREHANTDWKDEFQESILKYHVNPIWSYGPLEITPYTYLQALIVNNGILKFKHKDISYDNLLSLAKNYKLLEKESDIPIILLDPKKAVKAYEEVLTMYIPKKGERIEILVDTGDESGPRPHYLDVQDEYTFARRGDKTDNKGGEVTYSYDEMRLMVGIGRYTSDGLRFLSKDKDVEIDGDTIVNTEALVLNNVITYITANVA